MKRYLKIYKIAYEEGINNAIEDLSKNKRKIFKDDEDVELKSQIYDLGFIDGYNRVYDIIKKYLSFKNKI